MIPDPFLLSLIECIACRAGVEVDAVDERAEDGHVMTGRLRCQSCDHTYPIVRGIPRMLAGTWTEEVEQTVVGFGYEWTKANPLIQNTRFTAPETFLDFIAPVQPEYFRDKVVLDGGCGTGRFSVLAQEFGAKAVVAVDLGESVDVTFENTRAMPNVIVVQADLFNLPVGARFDYAFSVGVLHHTSDPRGAFQAVSAQVKPGGGMSAWVYGREGNGWVVHVLNPIRRNFTSKLPHGPLLVLSYLLTAILYLPLKCIYRPVGKYEFLAPVRKVLFYFGYLHFMSQFGFHELAVGVVFDHLVPSIAEYIPREEFEEWFAARGLEEVVITSRAGNSWRGFGRVPGTSAAP